MRKRRGKAPGKHSFFERVSVKLLLPTIILAVFYTGFGIIQITSLAKLQSGIRTLAERDIATISSAGRLKLDIVQIQQQLKEISATLDNKGFADADATAALVV